MAGGVKKSRKEAQDIEESQHKEVAGNLLMETGSQGDRERIVGKGENCKIWTFREILSYVS